jgi:hypothetical protein
MTIENSTISGNTANNKYGYGGGVYNNDSATIKNSTITGNKVNVKFGYGGGIANNGDLTLERTLISGNKGAFGPEVANVDTVTADARNLFGLDDDPGTDRVTVGATDIVPGAGVGLGAILGGLKDNGGPTKTHALKIGSPAVNAVPFSDPGCTGTDQRGVSRPQPPGGNCDIGAFELQ